VERRKAKRNADDEKVDEKVKFKRKDCLKEKDDKGKKKNSFTNA
jgi:hypothetical protein